MSFSILKQIGDAQKKKAVVDVRSGDTVKVTQKIKEGNKFRLQTFEGVVIRVDRKNSHTERIVVRKVTSGVGVEKSYLVHSPLVEKIEITKRAKVRRNNLSYLRQRSGKSARLASKDFDRAAVNDVTATEEAEEIPVEADEVSGEEVEEAKVATEGTEAVEAEDKAVAEAEVEAEEAEKDKDEPEATDEAEEDDEDEETTESEEDEEEEEDDEDDDEEDDDEEDDDNDDDEEEEDTDEGKDDDEGDEEEADDEEEDDEESEDDSEDEDEDEDESDDSNDKN